MDIPNQPRLAPADANPIGDAPKVTATWENNALHLLIEGKVTPEHLAVLAFTVQRTANAILDAMQAHAAETAPPRIVPVHGKLRGD